MSYEALAACIGRGRSQVVGEFADDAKRLWPQVLGGAVGAMLWRKHPVLGLLGGSAVGRNTAGIARGEIEKQDAARSLGAHVMATAGALSIPGHPFIGYAAGAVAGGILNEVVSKTKKPFWELVTGVRNEHLLGGDQTIPIAATFEDYDTVLAVQKALEAHGYSPGPIDGKLGPKTKSAIKALQASLGAAQTGTIDYGVLSALGVSAPTGAHAIAKNQAQSLPSDGRPAKGWSQQLIQPGAQTPGVHIGGRPIWQVALIALAGVAVLSTGIILIARHA